MNTPLDTHENTIQAIVRNLKSEFWIWAVALFTMSIMAFFFGPSIANLSGDDTIAVQSLSFLILFTGLPATFIWFRNRMNELKALSDISLRLKKYQRYSRIRQGVFFAFGLLVLVVEVFTNLKNGYMLLLVVVVLSIFIVPSRTRLLMEARLRAEDSDAPDSTIS